MTNGREPIETTDHAERIQDNNKARRPPAPHSKSWIPRRNKHRTSLFPLPVKIPPPQFPNTAPATPRASTSGISSGSPNRSPGEYSPPLTSIRRTSTADGADADHPPLPSPHNATLAAASIQFAAPGGALLRNDSTSGRSDRSTPALAPPLPFKVRNRSGTLGSAGARSEDGPMPPPTPPNVGGGRETAGKYLARVEECVDKSQIASVLSKEQDDFFPTVMRSFMRKFLFFGDPLDMAIRKLLMEVDLPKETQQIDRVLQSFADRYHECNPGIFVDSDKAYFIAFSILILQTDAFNKNNKRKMSKPDYLKNSSVEGVSDDVLGCFYDNIVYTPFIRVEDEIDAKNSVRKHKKTLVRHGTVEQLKKAAKEPIDPYALILEGRLDVLRPPLREVMNLDDPYTYLGTAPTLDVRDLNKNSKCGVLQIESLRSRPDAFLSPSTIDNPEGARSGLVDLPVDKVGVLWRKDPKKKTARSPWQEWGAILTGSGLSFFRNAGWVKNLMHQHDTHVKHGHGGGSVIFRPPIQMFKPDYFLPTENGVALYDNSYRRHKNGFVFFTHSGTEEVFLADNEPELNDWLAKLNHQASYRTAGIRPRGLVGGNYEGQRQRALRRLQSSNSTRTIQTPTGEVTIQSGNIDFLLAQQISAARRENMQKKIEEFEERLSAAIRQLDGQLRDARHLLVLAPIQQKTREQLVHCAGRIAAQLKWIRIDIWRMKCHRDILALDLEEENKLAGNTPTRSPRLQPQATSPVPSSTHSTERLAHLNDLLRLGTSASGDAEDVPELPELPEPRSPTTSARPDTKGTTQSSQSTSEDEVYKTPPENTPQPSPAFPPAVWGPVTPRTPLPREPSTTSQISQSPKLDVGAFPSSMASATASEAPPDSPNISEYNSPISENTATESKPRPLPSPFDGRPGTASDSELEQQTPASGGSPESKTKTRRSLKGTLREVRESPMGHHRSRKGKDSNSSGILSMSDIGIPEAESEGLSRTKGSFTVHGKKASVVTFGSEWQDMSPEEKLKLRKQAQAQSNELAIIPTVAEPAELNDADVVPTKKSTRTASSSSVQSAPVVDLRRGSSTTAQSDGNARIAPAQSIRERMAARKQSYQSTRGISRTTSEEASLSKKSSVAEETEEDEVNENEQAPQLEGADGNSGLKKIPSAQPQPVEA
ncbi:hypothetical protein NA57DRAFT_36333 [Rhizodiscina lignyota]|uniref:Uncharacterized protein n=1 Tax=Rhizodiscina lignyota TaxID=1504668 RepID=A0A9P4IJZ8_9PEZI|nr:hypothetical protein NA57DRAFT_36333 [Rhizodiscina lignyota]